MYFLEILLPLWSLLFSQKLHLFFIKPYAIISRFSIFCFDSSLQRFKVLRRSPWKQGWVGGWDLLCSVIFVAKLVCSDQQQHRQKQFPRKPKHSAISRQLVKNPEKKLMLITNSTIWLVWQKDKNQLDLLIFFSGEKWYEDHLWF